MTSGNNNNDGKAIGEVSSKVSIVEHDGNEGDIWSDDDDNWDSSEINDVFASVGELSTSWRRFCDKMFFCLGVGNVVVTVWFVAAAALHFVLPIFYSLKFPILIFWRLVSYRKHKYQFFLLDFCYYGNLLLLAYLWLFPGNTKLFTIVFSVTNGPMLWAIILFRNSLVFHSVDKLTSMFIHLTPCVTCFLIRWRHKDHRVAEFWSMNPNENSMLYTWVFPMIFFLCHQLFYLILMKAIKLDKSYLTTYRYLSGGKRAPLYAIVRMFGHGQKQMVLVFGLVFTLFTAITLLPCALWYRYEGAHIFALVLALCCATFNGANFYFEVFTRKYEFVRKAQQSSHNIKDEKI